MQQRPAPDGLPDVIRIEPVGKCNFRCIHCPTGTKPNQRQAMKEDQFSAIVSQLVDGRCIPRVGVLYHGGEPLLNRRAPHYIRMLKDIGVARVQPVSNGSLLTRELAEELIRAGLDEIHVSFDGESADENNRIRRNGDFHRDANNVKEFYRLYGEIGHKHIRILVSNVRIRDTKCFASTDQTDCEEVPAYLTRYFGSECEGIEFQSIPAMVWPGLEAHDDFEVVCLPASKPACCGPLFETLTILANGDVVPCCYDLRGEVSFGNVFERDLLRIWASQKYTEFRADFRRQIYSELCRRCSVVAPRYLCRNSE